MTSPLSHSAVHCVGYDNRRGLLTIADLAGAAFHEATFDDTVRLLNRAEHRVRVRTCGPSERTAPGDRPRILIVHTGRCGSTLLANALALTGGVTVLKEPRYLHRMVYASVFGESKARPIAQAALRIVAAQYLPRTSREHQFVVIKTTSWNAVALPLLLATLKPEAVLLLHRDPADVIASQLHHPPAWKDLLVDPAAPRATTAAGSAGMTESLALYCWVWKSVVRAARAALANGVRLKLLSYDELVTAGPSIVSTIFGVVGVAPKRLHTRAAAPAFDLYSKAAAPEPFRASSRAAELDAAVARWLQTATAAEREFLASTTHRLTK
jgi:hypothetical protein